MVKKILPILILTATLLLAAKPLTKPFVYGTADGLGHRFRLVSFYTSLKDGNLKPRWAGQAALGYGAPTFLFNYPLPYYLGSVLLAAGLKVDQAARVIDFLPLLLSGIFMYLLVGKLVKSNLAAAIAGAVYILAPYHLQMTYLYEAWGEIMAFVFPPLIVLLILEVNEILSKFRNVKPVTKTSIKSLLISYSSYFTGVKLIAIYGLLCLAWFGFVLSHNVSVIMFTPVILVLILVFNLKSVPTRQIDWMAVFIQINAFLVGVLWSAFFWLPAVVLQYQMKYPQFLKGEGSMRNLFYKPLDLQWNTALKVINSGVTHYTDFTAGMAVFMVVIVGSVMIILAVLNLKRVWHFNMATAKLGKILSGLAVTQHKLLFTILLLLLAASLFFTSNASGWFWELPPFNYILYPFRCLFMATYASALLAGIMVKKNSWLGIILLALVLVGAKPYLNPYFDVFDFKDEYFYGKQTFTSAPFTRKNMLIKEFLPVSANAAFLETEENKYREDYFAGKDTWQPLVNTDLREAVIKNLSVLSEKTSMDIEATKNTTLSWGRFYFPNWKAALDNTSLHIVIDTNGVMQSILPAGKHHVMIYFSTTGVEETGYFLSLFGIIIFTGEIIIIVIQRKHENK